MHFQRRLWKFSLNGKAFEDSWHQRLELVSYSSQIFHEKTNSEFRIFSISFINVIVWWKDNNNMECSSYANNQFWTYEYWFFFYDFKNYNWGQNRQKRPMHLTKNKQFSALEKKKQFRKKIVDLKFRISCWHLMNKIKADLIGQKFVTIWDLVSCELGFSWKQVVNSSWHRVNCKLWHFWERFRISIDQS